MYSLAVEAGWFVTPSTLEKVMVLAIGQKPVT